MMEQWDREKSLEYYKALAKHLSEGLASYLDVVDWSENELSHDWKILLGNLPMGCPNCGRMRLNFHPDLQRIDCEKCDWYAGTSVPGDEEFDERDKWSGWQVGEVKVGVHINPKKKIAIAEVKDGMNMLTYEGEDFGAEQALACLLADFMRRKSVLCREDLDEVIRILWEKVEDCETYNCEEEAMNTRRILERLGSKK